MIKGAYLKEIANPLKPVQKGSTGMDAQRVQEWLNLWGYYDNKWKFKCTVDADFGPQTDETVKKFQTFRGLFPTGVVDEKTWSHLRLPLMKAFSGYRGPVDGDIRAEILAVAKCHLASSPRELAANEGPWVRAYMNGHDGKPYAWCVGSTLTVIDQAFSIHGKKFTSFLPNTLGCDELANYAMKQKRLIRNVDLKKMTFDELKKAVKPGDILNLSKTPTDWTHTALITAVAADHFETWEGNTNDEGSREGFEVCARIRNFTKQNVDVIQLGIE